MGTFKNPAIIPQGMLAPSGLRQDYLIDPVVQSTTRPAGSLLRSSPGYDSVRVGKNRFQGKGPTGGFREMEFAEDVGGSGAAISIVPGDTSQIESSEWLPEDPEQVDEGSFIIADRNTQVGGTSSVLHEAESVLTDLGDRSPGRPLSRSLLYNPAKMLRKDYQENPVVTVLASAGLCVIAYIVGNDLEREYRSRRGGSVASEAAAIPASGAAVSGDEVDKVTGAISDAGDKAVKAIGDAADAAVDSVNEAGKAAKDAADKAANTVTE
jgi:hypothetical protein